MTAGLEPGHVQFLTLVVTCRRTCGTRHNVPNPRTLALRAVSSPEARQAELQFVPAHEGEDR